MKKYFVEPSISGEVTVGEEKGNDRILLGKLSERSQGRAQNVWLNTSKEFISIVIGQRGSGKSFCLGSMLESFATTNSDCTITKRIKNRAVLLLDPTGNFWTTSLPLTKNGTERVVRQYKTLEGWGIEIEDIDSQIWIPAGYRADTDSPSVKEFYLDTSDFDEQDWGDILGINTVTDPQGMLLGDVYFKCKIEGWEREAGWVEPKPNPKLQDLIDCLVECIDFNMDEGNPAGYQKSSIKVLIRNLKSLARRPLFSGGATKLTDLLKEGQLSVLLLPYRVDRNLRSVLSRVLINRILRDREISSQIQNRLDFEQLESEEKQKLNEELKKHIPRTLVALDEAQELLGDRGGRERAALEDFCLIGRNFGLSMIIATQRPETNALSPKVRDQAGVWLIHQLASQANINTISSNLIATFPESVSDGKNKLDLAALLRSLQTGQALVASRHMSCGNEVRRSFCMDVRPRVRIHGGEAS
jgi:Helicase HerA, central domain